MTGPAEAQLPLRHLREKWAECTVSGSKMNKPATHLPLSSGQGSLTPRAGPGQAGAQGVGTIDVPG